MAELTNEERKQLHELVELAHGYSILQSAVPMLLASTDLGLRKTSPVFVEAKRLVDLELQISGVIESKPALNQYQQALARVLDKLEGK